MARKEVFQEHRELHRLVVQNRLLRACEQPVYRRLISGRSGLKLLDVGCNDGRKTADRFSCEEISRVVGLEYHKELAERAQAAYGGGKFAFCQCDVEDAGFPRRLKRVMEEQGVDAFDLINVSFVLLHLKDPAALLQRLRGFLSPGGRLIVVEADDGASRISADPGHLFRAFLDMLRLDPFAGDRLCGGRVLDLLARCGYGEISLENTAVSAKVGEAQKKRDIFEVFFSYLPQDLRFLRELEPDNPQYARCAAWLERHCGALRRLVLSEDTELSMGISIITCANNEWKPVGEEAVK